MHEPGVPSLCSATSRASDGVFKFARRKLARFKIRAVHGGSTEATTPSRGADNGDSADALPVCLPSPKANPRCDTYIGSAQRFPCTNPYDGLNYCCLPGGAWVAIGTASLLLWPHQVVGEEKEQEGQEKERKTNGGCCWQLWRTPPSITSRSTPT